MDFRIQGDLGWHIWGRWGAEGLIRDMMWRRGIDLRHYVAPDWSFGSISWAPYYSAPPCTLDSGILATTVYVIILEVWGAHLLGVKANRNASIATLKFRKGVNGEDVGD